MKGKELFSRPVVVDVAEAKTERESSSSFNRRGEKLQVERPEDREFSKSWRRETPLPPSNVKSFDRKTDKWSTNDRFSSFNRDNAPTQKSKKASPFGNARPVDIKYNEEKTTEWNKIETEPKKANPFGQAKPVQTKSLF